MKNLGFSLLELSIVLVIIGLLAGGVMVGQDLVRQAELRSITEDFLKFQTAISAFKNKYSALPGDMRTATSYWGKDNSACSSDTGNAATNGTCNGNNNGTLQSAASNGATAEMFQFWKHLNLAGILEGNYSGTSGSSGTSHSLIDVNVPGNKIAGAGWTVQYIASPFAGNSVYYAGDYGNNFSFGSSNAGFETDSAAISPSEAYAVDLKIDDGKPATGFIVARFWNNLCAAADNGVHSSTNLVASYKLSDTATRCALVFRKAF